VGVRTKYVVDLVEDELKKLGYAGDAEKVATEALKNAGIKLGKDNKSDALFFMSRCQARELAKLVNSGENDKKVYQKVLVASPSIDIALFGRMVASDPSLNFDAASQVAHSISTHEVSTEYDYFTAVDDLAREDNAGAGHLGTVEFNSSTLYRYATVNVRELEKNLGDDAIQAVHGFVKAFLLSMPTGKQNTFANRTAPDFAYITLRSDQPLNLAGAFEKPVYTRQEGYLDKSVLALKNYANRTYGAFVAKPDSAYCIGLNENELGANVSLSELLALLEKDINSYRGEE
jgi:CRISPR system Cascade subunit CasC